VEFLNRYASAFAEASKAFANNINDGGIAGPVFFDHVTRLRRPVLDSPKRHAAPMPPTLTRRPVSCPVPLWVWALFHRADDTRPMVAPSDPQSGRPRLEPKLANTSL
jgi:hypothetical protein